MFENQEFIAATDFLKRTTKLNFREIAAKTGVNNTVFSNIRRGVTKLPDDVKKSLIQKFPNVEQFFKNTKTDTVGDSLYLVNTNVNSQTLKELVETQKQLISMQNETLEALKKEVEILKTEIRILREMLGK